MQTNLTAEFINTPEGKAADKILRSCVHCGFCTATCPTYQELGDELDGPRGRIYLIKKMLEGSQVTESTQQHLDRCLTCRSCETTCPSGVEYSHLLDIGRHYVESKVKRSWWSRLQRYGLRKVLPFPKRFALALRLTQILKPVLPFYLRPPTIKQKSFPAIPDTEARRTMLLFRGCVQPALSPNLEQATRNIFAFLGIRLIPVDGCCGAIDHHLAANDDALIHIKRNLRNWLPLLESHNAEGIIVNASGCGSTIKDYRYLLQHDAEYADMAQRLSSKCYDPVELLMQVGKEKLGAIDWGDEKLAFHPPCSLQHGQQLQGQVESFLNDIGITLTPVVNAHLCCGSAGTYSVTQPRLSQKLLKNKLEHLLTGGPERIISANTACQTHLASRSPVPVLHWLEVLAEKLPNK